MQSTSTRPPTSTTKTPLQDALRLLSYSSRSPDNVSKAIQLLDNPALDRSKDPFLYALLGTAQKFLGATESAAKSFSTANSLWDEGGDSRERAIASIMASSKQELKGGHMIIATDSPTLTFAGTISALAVKHMQSGHPQLAEIFLETAIGLYTELLPKLTDPGLKRDAQYNLAATTMILGALQRDAFHIPDVAEKTEAEGTELFRRFRPRI